MKKITLIIGSLIVLVVLLTGCGKKEENNKISDNEITSNNTIENNLIDENNSKEKINEAIKDHDYEFWLGWYPDRKYYDEYVNGLCGKEIRIYKDYIWYDLGNGSWATGKYIVKDGTIESTIEEISSEWHKEAEKLDEPVKIVMSCNMPDGPDVLYLKIESISQDKITFHTIDMISGELTDTVKERELIEYAKGNLYGNFEGGVDENGFPGPT